jgi:glucosylceramidase
LPKYDNLKNRNESFPSKNMLFTEGCVEGFDSEKLQFCPNAERYGNSIINDFNSGVVG